MRSGFVVPTIAGDEDWRNGVGHGRAAGLVGRDGELAAVVAALRPGTITTVVGPSGIGKSALARAVVGQLSVTGRAGVDGPDGAAEADSAAEAAGTTESDGREVGPRHPLLDLIVVCDLAGLVDPSTVVTSIVEACGLLPSVRGGAYETLVAHFGRRAVLLLLDGGDQVAVELAATVHTLLEACPTLCVLATVRSSFGLRDETVVPLGPLSRRAGVQLLTATVGARTRSSPDLGPTWSEAVDIVEMVGGSPLALELVGARLAGHSVAGVVAGLRRHVADRPEVETSGAADVTLRWLYDALEPADRAGFQWLSVFVGGFTEAAADDLLADCSAVTGAGGRRARPDAGPWLGADVVRRLVANGFVHELPPDSLTPRRFAFDDPVRRFADLRLGAAGERAPARDTHLVVTGEELDEAAADAAGPRWRRGARRIARERANVRAAVEWAEATLQIDDLDRLLRDLWLVAYWQGDVEPAVWAGRAIRRGTATGARPGAPAHLHAARAAANSGVHVRSLEHHLLALEVDGTDGDRAWARLGAAEDLVALDRIDDAVGMIGELLDGLTDDPVERVLHRAGAAVLLADAGLAVVATALAQARQIVSEARANGSVLALGAALHATAVVARAVGEHETCSASVAEAHALAEREQIGRLGFLLTRFEANAQGPAGRRPPHTR